MAFHNVSMPDAFQYGSVFGAGFATVVQETSTGHEYRLARQSQARHRYRLLKLLQGQTEAMALKSFALARRGAEHSFRLKDWSDYTSNADGITAPTNVDQLIGVGDGTTKAFRLYKTYDISGPAPYQRPIDLPVAGSVVVALNGSNSTAWTLTNPGGIVTFTTAPTAGVLVTAGFQFDVPVRFAQSVDEWTQLRSDAFLYWTLDQIECVEVLGEVATPELWEPGGWTDHGAITQDVTISYAQGRGHSFAPSTGLNVFLPAPGPTRAVGGPKQFVVENKAGSAGTIQIRDDAGGAVGSSLSAGAVVEVGLVESGGSFRWLVY